MIYKVANTGDMYNQSCKEHGHGMTGRTSSINKKYQLQKNNGLIRSPHSPTKTCSLSSHRWRMEATINLYYQVLQIRQRSSFRYLILRCRWEANSSILYNKRFTASNCQFLNINFDFARKNVVICGVTWKRTRNTANAALSGAACCFEEAAWRWNCWPPNAVRVFNWCSQSIY